MSQNQQIIVQNKQNQVKDHAQIMVDNLTGENAIQLNVSKQILVEQKIVTEKLEVSIIPKIQQQKIQQNPQVNQFSHDNKPSQQQGTKIPDSKFGPFNSIPQQNFQLKPVNQIPIYQFDVSPILNTNTSKQTNKKASQRNIQKQPKTKKKSSSILTQQSLHESGLNQINSSQIQKEILQLAKNIRKKVINNKKLENNQFLVNPSVNNLEKNSPIKSNHNDNGVYQKRLKIFQKYSFPRTSGLDLSKLWKQQQNFNNKQPVKYNTSRVVNQQEVQQSIDKTDNENLIQIPKKRSYSRTQDSKNSRNKQQLLPKIKLNLDPTHHKYRITQFRKSILKEKKQRQLAKELIEKQKEQTLKKRKNIFNNSRYNPVGIKLSSLRASKLMNRTDGQANTVVVSKVLNSTTIDLKQASQDRQEKTKQIINSFNPQQSVIPKDMMNSQANPSQLKSSLTFNFSFSDRPSQLQNTPLKTSSQVIKQLDDLTKQLQNDSTPQQRFNKISQRQKQLPVRTPIKNEIQTKKWSNISQQMTQSKNYENIQKLHNSSEIENNEEQQNNTTLQYSYF